MIWGYHYFWKHPYPFLKALLSRWCSFSRQGGICDRSLEGTYISMLHKIIIEIDMTWIPSFHIHVLHLQKNNIIIWRKKLSVQYAYRYTCAYTQICVHLYKYIDIICIHYTFSLMLYIISMPTLLTTRLSISEGGDFHRFVSFRFQCHLVILLTTEVLLRPTNTKGNQCTGDSIINIFTSETGWSWKPVICIHHCQTWCKRNINKYYVYLYLLKISPY